MEKKKVFYGWWIVIGCILVTATLVPLVMALFNKFLLQVTTEMGVSRSAFSINNTIIQVLGVFLSPFIAKFLARGNQRMIQSICILGFGLAYASYGLAQNVIHLCISSFFVGVFFLTSTLIPITIMITNWFTEKRGLAMSLAMTGIGFGGFIFSPLISYFLSTYGWRSTYLFMAVIVTVVALPISLFVFRKHPKDMGLLAYGEGKENKVKTNQKTKLTAYIQMSVKDSRMKLFFFLLLGGHAF